MKWIILHSIVLLPIICFSQLTVDNNAIFKVDKNATVSVPIDVQNNGAIHNSGTLIVEGNWENKGSNADTGTIIFQGVNQQISQNGNVFYNVIIAGGGNKDFLSRAYISHNLDLQNGYVIPTDTAKIILLDNATTSSGYDGSFVKGALYAKGQGNKYYPIGHTDLFLPIELHSLTGTNPIIGFSAQEFANTPITGKGTDEILSNSYWKMDIMSGTYENANISLPVPSNLDGNIDSIVVVRADSLTAPFRSIGNNPAIISIIPGSSVTSIDSAKAPLFTIGMLLDVDWDLLYIPNALSQNATNPEEQRVKVYGNLFQESGFSFVVTNQWGNKIFESKSLAEMENTGWTGINTRTQKREATGQYFYYFNAITKNNIIYEKAGSIWLID